MRDADSVLLCERKRIDGALLGTYNKLAEMIPDAYALSKIEVLMKWSYERGKIDLMLTQEYVRPMFEEPV